MSHIVVGVIFVAVLVVIGYYGGVVAPRRKQARTEASLEHLRPVVAGTIADGKLTGTYQRYGVEARPKRVYPGPPLKGNPSPPDPPPVNIFEITLAGVPAGQQRWECRSAPKLLATAIPPYWPRLINRLINPRFAFKPHTGQLRQTPLDPALQERLRSAGLLDELTKLRWGNHPYLPKARFGPAAVTEAAGQIAAAEQRMHEALRATGRSELEPLFEQKMHERVGELEKERPDTITLEVEMGRHSPTPSASAFQELLDSATRIAQINEQANPAAQ